MKNHTKIVATIGPVSANPETLLALAEAGMSVARLNGSHANLEWHEATIQMIRKTLPDTPILMDIPGRKIRTGLLTVEPSFKRGEKIILTTEAGHDGSKKVPVNYATLHEDLKPGATVLADDGTLRFVVESIQGQDVICMAEVDGTLRSRKGINVPYVKLRTQLVTERDREMMAFCVRTGIDYVGISFVESSDHVEKIRALIPQGFPKIVAKIENQGGLDHQEEVIESADAIMIDRGDLSVETDMESVALKQKVILKTAQQKGKPVIVATEMLHSMIQSPLPTKAEIADITNAVLDGCAATMLSGETAVGNYALDAVSLMSRVSGKAEVYVQETPSEKAVKNTATVPEAMGEAIALLCRSLPITKIVAVTLSGYAARRISSCRPKQPILAVSNNAQAARSFNLYYGTTGVHLDILFSQKSTDHVALCLKKLWETGKILETDMVLVTTVGYPKSGNRMNMIETHVVVDLVETLGWNK